MAATPSFDDREGSLWYDGKLVPWREANTHVLTHGLHYGSSVFEGERIYSGRIYKHKEHIARLFESARILGMTIPVHASRRSSTPATKPRARRTSPTAMSAPWSIAAAR